MEYILMFVAILVIDIVWNCIRDQRRIGSLKEHAAKEDK